MLFEGDQAEIIGEICGEFAPPGGVGGADKLSLTENRKTQVPRHGIDIDGTDGVIPELEALAGIKGKKGEFLNSLQDPDLYRHGIIFRVDFLHLQFHPQRNVRIDIPPVDLLYSGPFVDVDSGYKT